MFKVQMKTILSIPLILLILFTGIHVNFATHYCGGTVAATKVSLTGELATCGMEKQSGNKSFQDIYSNKCCEDITSIYSICNNYVPSSFFVNNPWQQFISDFYVPFDYQIYQAINITVATTNIKPPGINTPNSLSCPSLCIFRI
jgi:hypothetical protein